MDYLKHSNSKVHNQLLSHSSKRSIKFLLCFSLLCFLFSSLPLLLQFLKPFLKQFFSYIIEKSYMFLLCNGLLVLIAVNSGLINASSPPSMARAVLVEEPDIAAEETASPQEEEEEEEEEEKIMVIVEQENVLLDTQEEEEKSMVIVEQENVLSDTQEEEDRNSLGIIDEDEDDTEELNKKCEDFIKKMKATFSSNKLEPRPVDSFYFDNQKWLVAVN